MGPAKRDCPLSSVLSLELRRVLPTWASGVKLRVRLGSCPMKFRTIVQLVIAGMLGILSRDVAVAQSVPRGVGTIEIQVRVTYQGTNTPAKQVKVELLSLSEIPLQQKFTDAQGRVSFVVDVDRPPLEFRVRASGQGIEESVSDHVRFERRVEAGSSRIVDLEVKSTGEPQPQTTTAVTS